MIDWNRTKKRTQVCKQVCSQACNKICLHCLLQAAVTSLGLVVNNFYKVDDDIRFVARLFDKSVTTLLSTGQRKILAILFVPDLLGQLCN